ncbi:hypothetical protein HDE_07590 [Halotydeus destructor]|nr:hypothetical protein HDE_07590 [Halotydeus destructor]
MASRVPGPSSTSRLPSVLHWEKLDAPTNTVKNQPAAKVEVDQDTISPLDKELHERRLKSLQEVAEKLKDDSWKYTPIEKLLGL